MSKLKVGDLVLTNTPLFDVMDKRVCRITKIDIPLVKSNHKEYLYRLDRFISLFSDHELIKIPESVGILLSWK